MENHSDYKDQGYEPLDLTLPVIPERKTLMPQPIGIGSPYMEDAGSFLARVAEKHSLRLDNMLYEFFPAARTLYFSKDKDKPFLYYGRFQKINSCDPDLEPLFEAVTAMHGRVDIKKLTTATWMPDNQCGKELLWPYRAWCTGCYQKWLEANEPVYDMLIWSVSSITVCPIHRIRLSSECPNCGKRQPFLSEKYRPGYCSFCKKWLGRKSLPSDYDIHDFRWHKWVFENLGEIIASSSDFQGLNPSERINLLMNTYFFDIPDELFEDLTAILNGYFLTFKSLLRLFYISGLDFAKLFLSNESSLPAFRTTWKLNVINFEWTAVSVELRKLEKEQLKIFHREPVKVEDDTPDSEEPDLYLYDVNLFDLIRHFKEIVEHDKT